jgi:hypothetical protein
MVSERIELLWVPELVLGVAEGDVVFIELVCAMAAQGKAPRATANSV